MLKTILNTYLKQKGKIIMVKSEKRTIGGVTKKALVTPSDFSKIR